MHVTRNCQHCGIEFQREVHGRRKDDPGFAVFCSLKCSAEARWAGHERVSRHMVHDKTHPLAGKNGRVLVYRRTLYDAIGLGPHPCHICGRLVDWAVKFTRGCADGELAVDHLDGDYRNDDLSNLAPACNDCNALRGRMRGWQIRTGLPFSVLLLDDSV